MNILILTFANRAVQQTFGIFLRRGPNAWRDDEEKVGERTYCNRSTRAVVRQYIISGRPRDKKTEENSASGNSLASLYNVADCTAWRTLPRMNEMRKHRKSSRHVMRTGEAATSKENDPGLG